ncbi:MAG: malto-oligosyltrehalose trehalohydrolase [Pseudomonadota bacterium]
MTGEGDRISRLFPKSWGAEYLRAGEVRFRTWSPSASRMSIRLADTVTPLTRQEGGWFELLASGVAPGSSYGFILGDGTEIPDPASRAQRSGVHGSSLVVDPTAYAWNDGTWEGRAWEEAAIYELHVGTFTPEGTFRAVLAKLDHLAALGITALELMPVAQFAGDRGWGYDGVLLYAPHAAYGSPEDMKALIDAAHGKGLMVFLDVVYNHFGPEGNCLPRLAPEFFDSSRSTPWGAGIAYGRKPVREFFIENALYWLGEFHLDGLRLDAVDQMRDPGSSPDILEEIARRVRLAFPGRRIHLMTEDNRNITRLHERDEEGRAGLFTAEWNDDFHTAAHVFATGETAGYFMDFRLDPLAKLARALSEGYVYQGEASAYRAGAPRGQDCRHLPPSAFINFLQNHDQIGNRAFGERLSSLADGALVDCLTAILILSPGVPLLFMGEEWRERRPFLFFTDFSGELAEKVRKGRRREFAAFLSSGEEIPDPNAVETFTASRLDWCGSAENENSLSYMSRLLHLRQDHIVPLLAGMVRSCGSVVAAEHGVLAIDWSACGKLLALRANLCGAARPVPPASGRPIFSGPARDGDWAGDRFPPRTVRFMLDEAEGHAQPG